MRYDSNLATRMISFFTMVFKYDISSAQSHIANGFLSLKSTTIGSATCYFYYFSRPSVLTYAVSVKVGCAGICTGESPYSSSLAISS